MGNPPDRPNNAPPFPRPLTRARSAENVVILFWTIAFVALVAGVLVHLAYRVAAPGEVGLEVSLYEFATQDVLWLAGMVALLPVLWAISRRSHPPVAPATGPYLSAGRLALACTLVFLVTFAGRYAIYHDFAVSMDEFMYRFQVAALERGVLLTPVSDRWFPLSHALRPGFLIVNQEYQFWVPGYRPGAALVGALFGLVRAEPLMNPLLCAASVWLVARLAKREMPQAPGAAAWGVALFMLSPQFLITGMSPYTMTAHLFASLLWIHLFTLDRPAAHVAAIALGCLALGLHHVHVHSFLALPFLLNLFFVQRRFALSLAYGGFYAIACLGWIFWMDVAIWLQGLERAPPVPGPASTNGDIGFVLAAVTGGFERHSLKDIVYWAVNVSRLLAWQNLALLPLVVIGLSRWREMPRNLRLMAWAVLTSLIPYVLLMPSQGHGWGYRYLHHIAGNLALIGAFGWLAIAQPKPAAAAQRMRGFVRALCLITIVAGLPLRFYQAEAFVRPWAKASEYLVSLPVDLVFVDSSDIWYGYDLVRNDPLLRNSPKLLAIDRLAKPELARLCAENTFELVDAERLQYFGMRRLMRDEGERTAHRQAMLAKLEAAGCI
mgnify:CR=1 FL=1